MFTLPNQKTFSILPDGGYGRDNTRSFMNECIYGHASITVRLHSIVCVQAGTCVMGECSVMHENTISMPLCVSLGICDFIVCTHLCVYVFTRVYVQWLCHYIRIIYILAWKLRKSCRCTAHQQELSLIFVFLLKTLLTHTD